MSERAKLRVLDHAKAGSAWAAFTDNGAAPLGIVVARAVMVVALCATVPTILGVSHGNRLFLSLGIAALPLFWVVAGFYVWRRICPLAVAGQLGRLIGRPGNRKISGWLAERYLLLQFGILWIALSLRLIATNGSAIWLAGFLVTLVVAAAITSLIYGGKTWCNFICPVGVVEKMYTEPVGAAFAPLEMSSACNPCVACKKHCPDIDLEQGYWKELPKRGRLVYFAWPGVVVAFYVYYWLYAGNWHYYFGGSWAYERTQPATWLDDGFHFVAGVPRVIAAPLTLVVFGAISLALFSAGEALWARGANDVERLRVRHRMFAIAGFTAFVAFYFFAGQPSLRRLPEWAVRGAGAVVVFAAAAIFFRRFRRREAEHVQEKFAEKILKKWEWGDAPPSQDLKDIYLLHTERTKQRAARLRAYRETVRELVADGVVTRAELVILDSLRAQLGISDKDHQNVIDGLSAEDKQLFDPQALVRDEIAAIERMAAAARAAPVEGGHAFGFVRHVARWRGTEHAAHALSLLDAMGDRPEIAAAREALLERPRTAVATVATLREVPKELVDALQNLWSEAPTALTPEPFVALCNDASRYVRAAAALVLARFDDDASRAAVVEATCDEDAMVRETARGEKAIEKLVLLREVPLFAELAPSHLEELAAVVVERHFEPGDAICREGESGDAVYLLVEGHVRVYTGGDGRPERPLGELDPVACIGEMAVLDAAPRSATVRATTRARCLMLGGDDFRALLEQFPEISKLIMAELVRRMRGLIAT